MANVPILGPNGLPLLIDGGSGLRPRVAEDPCICCNPEQFCVDVFDLTVIGSIVGSDTSGCGFDVNGTVDYRFDVTGFTPPSGWTLVDWEWGLFGLSDCENDGREYCAGGVGEMPPNGSELSPFGITLISESPSHSVIRVLPFCRLYGWGVWLEYYDGVSLYRIYKSADCWLQTCDGIAKLAPLSDYSSGTQPANEEPCHCEERPERWSDGLPNSVTIDYSWVSGPSTDAVDDCGSAGGVIILPQTAVDVCYKDYEIDTSGCTPGHKAFCRLSACGDQVRCQWRVAWHRNISSGGSPCPNLGQLTGVINHVIIGDCTGVDSFTQSAPVGWPRGASLPGYSRRFCDDGYVDWAEITW